MRCVKHKCPPPLQTRISFSHHTHPPTHTLIHSYTHTTYTHNLQTKQTPPGQMENLPSSPFSPVPNSYSRDSSHPMFLQPFSFTSSRTPLPLFLILSGRISLLLLFPRRGYRSSGAHAPVDIPLLLLSGFEDLQKGKKTKSQQRVSAYQNFFFILKTKIQIHFRLGMGKKKKRKRI